jgi:hypothetical protein
MTLTIETLDACVDCLHLVANGEVTDGDGNDITADLTAKVIAKLGIPRVLTHLAPACDQDCEGHFSWTPCGVCGDHLGGDRHPVALMTTEAGS